MTRRYGRALNGARVDEGVPASHWRTLTVLGAVSVSGWVAVMSIESPTDGAYLKEVLCPQLKPCQVVVMDNLGAHKVDGVRELIEQTGLSLLPAALLARLQPHREVLGPNEAKAPGSQSPLRHYPPTGSWRSPHTAERRHLFPPLRLFFMIIVKML